MLNVELESKALKSWFDVIAYQCDCGRYPYLLSDKSGFQTVLQSIYCEITPNCNNHCPGCGNVFGERPAIREPVLSSHDWARIFETFLPQVSHVVITGGEPTLHPHFFEILDAIDSYSVDYTIFTNARWPHSEDLIDMLKRKKRLKGLVISLHGIDDRTHEAFTQTPGSYRETIENIDRAVSAGIPVVLSTVITAYNVDLVSEICALARRLGSAGVSFNRLIGAAPSRLDPMPDRLSFALTTIASLSASGEGIRTGAAIPHCFFPSSTTVCGAGASFVTMDPWGNVRPCNHSTIIAGNALSDSARTILQSEALRNWRGFVPEPCKGCSLFHICGGGCKAESFRSRKRADPLIRTPIHWMPEETAYRPAIHAPN
jgi:AdoMet-dependent heme synthase